MRPVAAKLSVILLVLLAFPAAAMAERLPSLAAVVERVMPAVVNVSAVLRAKPADLDSDGETANLHPGVPRHHRVTALGSGFIIDSTGFIVTSGHLVAGAERITVITRDHRRHDARLIGRDDASDIAVLKIAAPSPLPHVTWADSDRAKVGDWVVAVGNPFGLGGTVTAGIISALGRDIDDGPYDEFLQIDAPINRGNSGGPTFDLDGRVLGINTAIFSPSGGSIGIGFAIPAKLASRIVRQLISQGVVDHGWLGVTTQNVTPSIAQSFAIDPHQPVGALIDDVVRGSPAARAGLRQGDVVLAVGGTPVEASHDLRRLIDQSGIGARVPLRVRRDGRDYWLTAVIGAAPEAAASATAGEGSSEPPHLSLGLELDPLTPGLRQALALPRSLRGVLVVGVSSGGAGDMLGLEVGDVIVAVSRRMVATPGEAARRLDAAFADGQVLVLVNRHGASHFLGAARDQNHLVTAP